MLIIRAINVSRRIGFKLAVVRLLAKLLRCEIEPYAARKKAWNILVKKHGHKVAYGPFEGMKLPQKLWWGDDRITQTLGTYEEHVLSEISKFSDMGADTFIDIGAADGYFVIGVTFSRMYSKGIAFEISAEGQQRIGDNATENECREKIEIHGEADVKSLTKLLSSVKKATVLIDIEGEEYDFLDCEMLKVLSNHFIICELHENLAVNGKEKDSLLRLRASDHFDVRFIRREFYSPNIFEEFNDLNDDERLLAMSEMRTKNTVWMICTPMAL